MAAVTRALLRFGAAVITVLLMDIEQDANMVPILAKWITDIVRKA